MPNISSITAPVRWTAGQTVTWGEPSLWSPATQRILTTCVWVMRVRAMNQGRK